MLSANFVASAASAAHRLRGELGAEGRLCGVYEKTRPEMDVWSWLREEEAEGRGDE